MSMKTEPTSEKSWKHIDILEWFTQEGEDVFMHWRFSNGEEIKRRTPFKEIPVIKVSFDSEESQ